MHFTVRKRGIIFVLILATITLIAIIVGQRNQNIKLSKNPNKSIFQTTLKNYCFVPNTKRSDAIIEAKNLPLTIDQKKLKVEDGNLAFFCNTDAETGLSNIFISIPNEDNFSLHYIILSSDPNYLEKAHLTNGKKIKRDNQTNFYIFVLRGFQNIHPTIDETTVEIAVIKELRLKSGESIYLSTYNTIIDKNDPRLIKILKDYAVYDESINKLRIKNPAEIDYIVADYFFKDLDNLASPESLRFKTMEDELSAFSTNQ